MTQDAGLINVAYSDKAIKIYRSYDESVDIILATRAMSSGASVEQAAVGGESVLSVPRCFRSGFARLNRHVD